MATENRRLSLAYIFSKFAHPPKDGKQSQFYETVKIFTNLAFDVHAYGISDDDIASGDCAKYYEIGGKTINIAHIPGRYDRQSLLWYAASYGISIGAARKLITWIKEMDGKADWFFIEGFPLAPLCTLVQYSKVIFGEVDSYLLRAHRLNRYHNYSYFKKKLSLVIAEHFESIALKNSTWCHTYGSVDRRFLSKWHGVNSVISIPVVYPVGGGALEPGDIPRKSRKVLVWADARVPYLLISLEKVLREIAKAEWSLEKRDEIIVLCGDDTVFSEDIAKEFRLVPRVNSIEEQLKEVDLVIIPDQVGTGIKNRVLHAMSYARCVIGFKAGWESIPVINSKTGIVCNSLMELNGAVEMVLSRPDQMRAIGLAGLKLIQDYFSDAKCAAEWKKHLNV